MFYRAELVREIIKDCCAVSLNSVTSTVLWLNIKIK